MLRIPWDTPVLRPGQACFCPVLYRAFLEVFRKCAVALVPSALLGILLMYQVGQVSCRTQANEADQCPVPSSGRAICQVDYLH